MASAFEHVIRSVTQELDCSGQLVPVDSLGSSTSFQPYSLVVRKPSSRWFGRRRYLCVNLFLRDILEPSTPEPDVERVGPFHFQDAVDGLLQGSLELAGPGQGKVGGGGAISGTSSASMNVCTLKVSPNTWEALSRERSLRQPEHKVLQQLRRHRSNVYVVTEVLQTQKEVEVTRTRKQEGSGKFELSAAVSLQGEGRGHLSCKRTVTIPSGSILAFQVALLVIDPVWDIVLFPDKKQRTFGGRKVSSATTESDTRGPQGLCGPGDHRERGQTPKLYPLHEWVSKISDGAQSDSHRQLSLADPGHFRGLQAEVRGCAQILGALSVELCQQLLGGLEKVLRDEGALWALEKTLEQSLCSGCLEPQDSPVGAILECLVLPTRVLEEELTSPIFYLLGALAVLTETQHVQLADLLKMGDLSGPLSLVARLLEQSTPWQEPKAVSLPDDLLRGRWDSKAPAWVLLEECGLTLQVGAPQVHWVPEAQTLTCALYACLVLLKLS